MKKVLVLLSGCGVYDGSEIHETVLTLLALDQAGIRVQCVALNKEQMHVVNHTNGEEMEPARNMLVEGGRIARGNIKDLATINVEDYSGVVMPGGFGAAKNWSNWAIEGPSGTVDKDVADLLVKSQQLGLPIVAFCMSPVVLAKAFEGTSIAASLTVGSTKEASPYEIEAISNGMNSIGASAQMATVNDIVVDQNNKIVTSPCYMMEASISEINVGIQKAIAAFKEML